MSPFTAFAFHPKTLHFETQEKDETVILFLRQHIILLVPWVVLSIVLFFLPTVLFPILLSRLSAPFIIPTGYIIVGTMFWYIATFGFLLTKFIHWYFNIFIVTDQRIVDIDFVNLLYKEFSETQIGKVQDITYNTKGILAAMFNYGNVIIQTAGEIPNFVFESVPHPDKVIDVISDLAKAKAVKETI